MSTPQQHGTQSDTLAPPTGWRAKAKQIGPGIMAAATGVGAGDLVASMVAGSQYGYTLLWALQRGLAGLGLVWFGRYALLERVMTVLVSALQSAEAPVFTSGRSRSRVVSGDQPRTISHVQSC